MLDFLRRKEKRKQTAESAAAAANVALAAHHNASAAVAAARTQKQPSNPLRDRNHSRTSANPPIAPGPQNLRRTNTRPTPRAKPKPSEKENFKRPLKQQKQEQSRWKRPQVPEKNKRKARRQKHEPAVLNKSVTTDRRRSVKVASPVVVPSQKPKRREKPSPERKPVEKHIAQPVVSSHQRKPSSDAPTWPHVDLASLLRTNDVAAADIPIRRVAAAASRDDATRLKMIREGVAVSIISLLRHEGATLDMRRNATFALAELAVLEACEDQLVAAGTIPVLVWLINSDNNPDRSTLSSACRGLRNLLGGQESTAVQAAKYGCVEPLLSIIDGRVLYDVETTVEAAAAISNLSHHGPRFQSYVIKHGGLRALSALGNRTENDEAMFHVVNVIAEFAREARWHRTIVSAEGLNTAFRSLRVAKDPEVVAEASRLIGNVAVTQKARAAVREAGGLFALVDRLARCKNFKEVVPSFDIVRAIANVCIDSKAAADALCQKDTASVLLQVYTAQDAPEKLIKTAFRALQILAHGSANRRAKVLYSVGIQVKRAGLAGLPVKRLYDLRQAILEDVENGDRDAVAAMPESLERLSRASVRLMNSGVVNHGRGNMLQPKHGGNKQQQVAHRALAAPPKLQRAGNVGSPQLTDRTGNAVRADHPAENFARKVNVAPNRFKSTGRVVSVTRNCKPRQRGGITQQGDRRPPEEEDYEGLARGNEEAKASEDELRARMLAREADGNMTQDFFELGQVLGKGGYGAVFMAKDIRTGDIVAIKRFHNNGALVDKKAVKEQNIWKGLHHPNVVEFKGSFVGDNGSLNLVVEYVDGLSLAEHLSQYTAFPETLVAEIARQVLCGLDYLHANGVTHRDLKPANILVDHSASVKICDFGVSRSDNVQTINPGQQHMVGTPWYIAPEMVEYRPYTTSVDIWSLGCTVLELATGRRPYHELSAMQVLFRMVEDRCPPIPSHLSGEAKEFLKACWVWDPTERPSALELLRHPFILKARKFSDSSKPSSATPGSSADSEILR